DEKSLLKFSDSLKDRFGPIPDAVGQLVHSVQLRWLGEELGFEKIVMKSGKLKAYFISGKDEYFKSDVFGKVLEFVQKHPRKCKLKDMSGKLILTIEDISSVDEALEILQPLSSQTFKSASEIVSA
ncbi:MAG TPA: transcription-repair coupling factor, partial [Cyclobacteriaceae bacterium]|nr:transcription-repair coupling factor [Cyclobacteriaceae bacterium]